MSWKRILKSPRRPARAQVRLRLDTLEDRTVLSPVVFQVDDSASTLTLAARVTGHGLTGALQAQDAAGHSLTTAYSGTIAADVDLDGGTIAIQAEGTALTAENSGDWQPKHDGSSGSEPANYGGKVSAFGVTLLNAAIRDVMVGSFTDQPLALNQTNDGVYQFASTEKVSLLAGSIAAAIPRIGGISVSLHGSASTTNQAHDPGTLTDNGDGTFSLVAPVSVSLSYSLAGFTASVSITGQIAAVGAPAAGPAASHGHRSEVGIALAAPAPTAHLLSASQALVLTPGYVTRAATETALLPAQDSRETGVSTTVHDRMESAVQFAAFDAAFLDLAAKELELA
jgi:hypothetical protein